MGSSLKNSCYHSRQLIWTHRRVRNSKLVPLLGKGFEGSSLLSFSFGLATTVISTSFGIIFGVLGGGFKHCLYSFIVAATWGNDPVSTQFDLYSSDGLKPPTRVVFKQKHRDWCSLRWYAVYQLLPFWDDDQLLKSGVESTTWMFQEVNKWLLNGLQPSHPWGILGLWPTY